jgi:hypothetical protein
VGAIFSELGKPAENGPGRRHGNQRKGTSEYNISKIYCKIKIPWLALFTKALRKEVVEQLMLAAGNKNPNVKAVQSASHRSRSNVRLDVDVDEQEALIKDMRRNPEKYEDQ